MNVLQTISSIDKNAGGTSTYLQLMTNELVSHIKVDIATLKSKHPLQINSKASIYFADPNLLDYSIDLKNYLKQIESDLFHGNGLWQYPVHAMAVAARQRNIPYIISPHGMLEPWAINTGKWKKKVAMILFQRRDLANANCIHATASMEAKNIRKLGFKNPIAVIPVGITLSEFPQKITNKEKVKKTVLFLSRIHPKKGIELLIEAWKKLDKSITANWQVEIAGNGDATYIATLQKLITNFSLQNEIQIIGPQFGANKLATYHRADLFVLPSYCENFGIVVAEALACGVPVITTKGTPWEELNTLHAGWWIDIGVVPLIDALSQAMLLTDTEMQQMGLNGRKLIEENYSIELVAFKMIEVYEWLLNKAEKPKFIY